MSYAVVPAPAKKRPGTVAAASYLLYLSAVLLVISAAVGFVPTGEISRIVNDYYADQPDQQQAASIGATIGVIITGIIYVLIAVALVVLGVLVGKGKQPARVITWVLGGLAVLCLGCGLAGTAVSGAFSGLGGGADQDLIDQIAAATPAWVTAVSTVVQILALIVNIAVIILLALPASNDFFRKEQQIWVPPTAFPGGPTQLPPPSGPPAL